jgi:hypothetical protein
MGYTALAEYPAPAFLPHRRVASRRRGMGAAKSALAAQAVSEAANISSAIALAVGAINPIAGLIVVGVGQALSLVISQFKGCGQTCIQATQYANQAAEALDKARSIYMSAPVHYYSAQQGTLQLMQQVFDALNEACGDPTLGKAGQNCISERLVRGGTAPWCPNPGHVGCDWITYYYDAVAKDPTVVPDPSPLSSVESSLSSVFGGGTSGGSVLPLVMVGALVLGLVWAL